jgi:hypothetical protein
MHRKKDENSILTILYSSTKFIFILCLSLFLFLPVLSQAKVSGPCSNCHTMHNSQDGSHMQYLAPGESDTGPKDALLRGSCLGCHSATDATTSVDSVTGAPIVFNSVEPTYNSAKGLAAGNFYYVQNPADDAKGHNVLASNPESTLTVAPGKSIGCVGNNSCHVNLSGPTGPPWFGLVTVRQGCNKCHMMGSDPPKNYHHADDSGDVIDSAAQGWYRFLAGHSGATGLGVTGIEDDDWEFETSVNHNEYLGFVANKVGAGGFQNIANTMTAYCTGCHGNFHVQDNASPNQSPWTRHPSDVVLPNSGEYSAYTSYDPLVPVARPDLSTYGGSSSNTINPGTDLVMCLSCHRAHASPYFKMMRWDYKNWPGGTSGCTRCHSYKD